MEIDLENQIQNANVQKDKKENNLPKDIIKMKPYIKNKNDDNKEFNKTKKKSKESEESIYYIPICREDGCNGHLKILIEEENFIVKFICENNGDHKSDKLFFETFDRFYLKDNKIQKCFNCFQIIENKDKYKCNKCKRLYCSSCFLSDMHIQKNFKNLSIINSKCQEDNNEKNYYCLDCKEKVCLFCIRRNEENSPHKNHNIINIIKEMPTTYQINTLKEKIKIKSEALETLIKSLTEWQNKLNQKIERIKQKLKCEISIYKKLFLNFNIDYIDYTYYSNFNEIFNNLKSLNVKEYKNKYLNLFMKSENFEEKTKYMFDFITIKESNLEVKEKKAKLKKYFKIGEDKFLDYFTGDLFLYGDFNEYSDHKFLLKLLKYDNNNDEFLIINEIKLNKKFQDVLHSLQVKYFVGKIKNQ